jgi:hypothetical protein
MLRILPTPADRLVLVRQTPPGLSFMNLILPGRCFPARLQTCSLERIYQCHPEAIAATG